MSKNLKESVLQFHLSHKKCRLVRHETAKSPREGGASIQHLSCAIVDHMWGFLNFSGDVLFY